MRKLTYAFRYFVILVVFPGNDRTWLVMSVAVTVNLVLVETVKGLAFCAGVGDVRVEEGPLVPGSDCTCTKS